MTHDPTPVEPDAIFNRDGSEAGTPTQSERETERILYWHVFGSPIEGKKGGRKNYAEVTAGPVPKGPDMEVTQTTIEGTHGETFKYRGTFTHEPSMDELLLLRPKAYR